MERGRQVFKFLIFLILICISIHCGFAQNEINILTDKTLSDTTYLLNGWFFYPNDNDPYFLEAKDEVTKYPFSGDSPWQYEITELSEYNDIGWYSYTFEIDPSVKESDIAIKFNLIYSAYQLYCNGKLLYQSYNWNDDNINAFGETPRIITIPYELLRRDNKNVFTVRACSYSGWGGAVIARIGYTHELARKSNIFNIKNIAISFVALFIFFYFILLYFLRNNEIYNLFIALSGLSVSLFVLGYYGYSYSLFNYPWAYWVCTFVGGINMYLMPILFIHSFFDIKYGIISKSFIVAYSFFSIFVIIEYIFTSQIAFFVKYIYNFFNLTYLLVVPYLTFLSIKALVKKYDFAKIMFIGTTFLILSFFISMLTFAAIIPIEPPIGEGFFAMIVAFSFILAKRFAQTHSDLEASHVRILRASNEIKELNESLEVKVQSRTQELREKNQQITESIEYAGKLQLSLLPSEETMKGAFSSFFTLWRPRETVGGDIYWLHKNEDGFLFAVIDCTGHGIPGALLSMSVSSSLDHIVNQMRVKEPSLVLKTLNNVMKNYLNQGDTSPYADDGLEIGLISYKNGNDEVNYAGSRLRLLVKDKNTIAEYKGNRQGIGFKRTQRDQEYNLHTIKFNNESIFFMSTDGFVEQPGGIKKFSFGWERFKEVINGPAAFPNEMKAHVEERFDEYREIHDQRDDILVVGFKITIDKTNQPKK